MKTITYRGIDIEIIPDENAQSPNEWENEDAFLVYDHRDFCVKRKGFDPYYIFEHMKETKKPLYDGYWYFPVYAYIHSGVSLSLGRTSYPFNDRWDVSFKGFALVKKQKGWTWKRDKAISVAQSIVNEWNDYLSGNVYGYNIEETGDSCWGFYGDYDAKGGCLDEAKSNIDSYIKEKRKSHFSQLKTWIKNKVPMLHREQMEKILFN